MIKSKNWADSPRAEGESLRANNIPRAGFPEGNTLSVITAPAVSLSRRMEPRGRMPQENALAPIENPRIAIFRTEWSRANSFTDKIRAIGGAQTYLSDTASLNKLRETRLGELELSELYRLVAASQLELGAEYQEYSNCYKRLCKKVRGWWYRTRPDGISWHRMEAALRKAWGMSRYELVVTTKEFPGFIRSITMGGNYNGVG